MSSNQSDHKSHAPTDEVASGRHRHFRSPPFALMLLAVGSLYAIACASPAVFTPGGGGGEWINFPAHTYTGLDCLTLGWLVPQHWIANIFLLIGLLPLGSGRSSSALVLGILAVFASASMMIVWKPDEVRSGYYLWVASMCAFVGGSFLFFLADRHQTKTRVAAKPRISAAP
jgi:hypothetical protein